jgi:DNA-binding LacI/PurR family transcriptional regulator
VLSVVFTRFFDKSLTLCYNIWYINTDIFLYWNIAEHKEGVVMSTIYDIAKKTGFSASTVARALNGKGYCSADSKEIILKAAEELGYVPHQAAIALKNNITKKIMLCIPDIMNPYYFAMIHGATRTLEQYGYSILLGYTMHDPKKELEVLDSLKGHYVDGLIFGSFDYTPTLIQAIRDTKLPTVITSFYHSSSGFLDYDCVFVDQPRAAWTATAHCIEKGHKQILFLGGNAKEQNTRERYEGYKKALEESNIPLDKNLVLHADFTREGAYQAFSDFINKGGTCTAVVACNDLMGVGCMNACRDLSLSVPDDISIVALDNTEYCLCTNPPMTSVDMLQGQVGEESANFVMDRIIHKREYQKNMAFSPVLVERESVKSLK